MYEIESSISDLSRDIPFDKTLAWSWRSSNWFEWNLLTVSVCAADSLGAN